MDHHGTPADQPGPYTFPRPMRENPPSPDQETTSAHRLEHDPAEIHDDLADLFIGPDLEDALADDALLDAYADDAAEIMPDPFGEQRATTPPTTPQPPQQSEPTTTPATTADTETQTSPTAEALLIGHLPVRASVWAQQYAGAIALADNTPVAMARIAPKGHAIALLGPGLNDLDTTTASCAVDAMHIARDTMRTANAEVPEHLIVRADDLAANDILDREWIGRVTVLTGPDETSTVAAYRILKSVAERFDELHGEGEGPVLQLAVVGADEETAARAFDRVRDVVTRFLRRDLEMGPVIHRASPVRAVELLRSDEPITADDLGEAWLAAEPTTETTSTTDTFADEAALEPALEQQPEPQTTPPPAPTTAGFIEPRDPAPEAPDHNPDAPTSLVSFIEGLNPLKISCPVARGITLAAQSDRRLAIIAEAGPNALDRIHAARAWAQQNRELIAMATETEAAEPVLHLIGERFEDLRPLLDAGIRLHLARRVSFNGVTRVITDALT